MRENADIPVYRQAMLAPFKRTYIVFNFTEDDWGMTQRYMYQAIESAVEALSTDPDPDIEKKPIISIRKVDSETYTSSYFGKDTFVVIGSSENAIPDQIKNAGHITILKGTYDSEIKKVVQKAEIKAHEEAFPKLNRER